MMSIKINNELKQIKGVYIKIGGKLERISIKTKVGSKIVTIL